MSEKKIDFMLDEEIKSTVLKNSDEIADLFKAIAHSTRIQILASLISTDLEFRTMQKQIHLSKTALANHLTHLIQFGLIKKKKRGLYSISENGKQLISTSAIFFNGIVQEENLEINRLQTQYQKGFHRLGQNVEKIFYSVPSGAIYQPCWLSYLGAVSGVLKNQSNDFDIVQVGGYSGYAFLINMAKGKLCPSGPTAINNWKKIVENTQKLGLDMEIYLDESPYPGNSSKPELISKHDEERALNFFKRIKMELEMNKRPCIVWGLGIPEFGIVNGYQNESYLASTYRWLLNQPEAPIHYRDLQAPGCLQAIFVHPQRSWTLEKIYHAEIDEKLFQTAHTFAIGKDIAQPGYISGPEAFLEWAEVLKWTENDPTAYHGNSYCGACYQEARGIAAVFLHQLFQKYHGMPQGTLLTKLVSIYQSEERYFRDFTNLFPFGFSGDLTKRKRDQGADLLKIIKEEEEKAINLLEKLTHI